MQTILQNSAAFPLLFLMIDSSDSKSGKTGLTPTVKIGKNGGAGANPAGTVSEVDSTNLPGWYKVAGNATDTNTLGQLTLHASASGADPTDRTYEVVAYNPQSATNLGLGNLDAASSTLATSSALSTLQTSVNNLVNLSALANLYGPPVMQIPASSSIAYSMQLLVKDPEGHQIDLTASPTVTAANTAGTDRSANLSSVSHPGTGHYAFTYTVASGAAEEGLVITATGTTVSPDSTSRIAVLSAALVAVDTAAAIAAIKAKTDLIATNSADSPNAATAQASAATAVTQTTAAAILAAVATTTNKIKTNPCNQVETSNPAVQRNVTVNVGE